MAFERRGRLSNVLVLLALVLVAISVPSAAQAQGLSVVAQQADASFPSAITFRATAAGVSVSIARAYLVFSVQGDDFSNLAIGRVEDSDPLQITYRLDTRRFFLPPGSQLSYYWELKSSDGATVPGPRSELQYSDDRFPWQRVVKGPVTVFWYAGSAAFADKVAAVAQQTYQKLADSYGVAASPIRIYTYQSTSDLSGALAAGSAEWIGGQTFPSQGIILAALGNDEPEVMRVVPHEVTHIVTWLASRNPYNDMPRWLDEGLAVGQELVDKSSYEAEVARAARAGTLPSVKSLSSNFAYSPGLARLSYASSYSFVLFLEKKFGEQKVVDLVRSFQKGLGYDEAVLAVLGADLDELNLQWNQSLSGSAPAPEDDPLKVSVLPIGIAIVLLALVVSIFRRR